MNTVGDLKNFEQFFTVVKRHHTFLLTAHVSPDPDAIASELAMARLLKMLGKRVIIINEDGVPDRFRFLPGSREIKKYSPRERVDFDAAVVLDSGDLRRIGRVARLLTGGKTILNVDHHITSQLFGEVNLIRVEASSTCEMIFDLIKYKRLALDRALAMLLYVGIMTDTGSFRFENTSAYTHRVAAELLGFGISPSVFFKKIYETVPLSDFKYFTHVVNQFKVLADGRVICLQLPNKILNRFSEEFDLRDKIFRELRTIKEVQAVFILTEEGRRLTKVNLRSHGALDVARIAAHFGGGGHRKASGCQLPCSMAVAKRKILDEILKFL